MSITYKNRNRILELLRGDIDDISRALDILEDDLYYLSTYITLEDSDSFIFSDNSKEISISDKERMDMELSNLLDDAIEVYNNAVQEREKEQYNSL
jgi:hypothetical protein